MVLPVRLFRIALLHWFVIITQPLFNYLVYCPTQRIPSRSSTFMCRYSLIPVFPFPTTI